MKEKEAVIDYMLNLQDVADYLIRGGTLYSYDLDRTIELRNDEITTEKNAFSISEYDIDDELEEASFGEFRSIEIIMEYMGNENLEEIKKKLKINKFIINTEFYKRTMNRAKYLIRTISLSIISGRKIELEQSEYDSIKESYLDDEEYYSEENETKGFLRYNVIKEEFEVINSEGRVIIEDIPTAKGIYYFTDFLDRKIREKNRKNNLTDKNKTDNNEER